MGADQRRLRHFGAVLRRLHRRSDPPLRRAVGDRQWGGAGAVHLGLGNIAGDSAQCRDFLLDHNLVGGLVALLGRSPAIDEQRHISWSIANLCRGKPRPALEKVSGALPVLAHLLAHDDDEVSTDACWGLSYACDGPNERIDAVLATGVLPALVMKMGSSDATVVTPALRACANIVTGNASQTQAALDAQALVPVAALMGHTRKLVRKEAVYFISNVLAGTEEQITAVVAAGLLAPLAGAMSAAEYEVRKEAVYALSNLAFGGTRDHILAAANAGCLPPLLDMLSIPDAVLIKVALEAIENILRSGNEIAEETGGENAYLEWLCQHGGADKVEMLQQHEDSAVYDKAVTMLEEFFGGEDEGNVRRRDPADGNCYTKNEFLLQYGGLDEWDTSPPADDTEQQHEEEEMKEPFALQLPVAGGPIPGAGFVF